MSVRLFGPRISNKIEMKQPETRWTLPYFWTLAIVSLSIAALVTLISYFVDEIFIAFSVTGFAVTSFWFSWQVSKFLKFVYDKTKGQVSPLNKAVLITGCSSGFGFELAVKLDSLGFQVFAGCRVTDDERARSLRNRCSDKLKLLKLDVTRDDEVDFALFQLEKMLNGNQLWAVVNNAGIASLHGVEWGLQGVDLYRQCMEVNYLGVVRVTKTALPLLRKTPGSRVVIVTSVEDRAEPLNQPSYAASKFATRAFANSLRRELRLKDIFVSVIEPSFYATGCTKEPSLIRMLEGQWRCTPTEVRESYGDQHLQLFVEFTKASMLTQHKSVQPVVDAMVQAVANEAEPKFYYRVCHPIETIILWFVDIFPEEIIDILQNNSFVIFSFKFLGLIMNGPKKR